MEKLRHTKGYYKGCYWDLDEKLWTLGETMTLKALLDCWWNSVRIRTDGKTQLCFKNAYTKDGTYELDELPKSALKKLVKVDDEYDEDADGYFIVRCEFVN